jgi:methionyl-tRNA formyltransferase
MQQHTSLRIVFAGTPAFAAEYLSALLASEHHIAAVYTQPDRPAGRGKKLMASPVKTLALAHNLPVHQPPSLRDAQAQQALAALNADIMVVVAYGLILPQAVLDIPRHGCLNVHASLLPRWRGAAPVQRAIEAGDQVTGITIMQMDAGLDTGPMLATARCPLATDDTTGSLLDRLAQLGREPLLAVLRDLSRGAVHPVPQEDARATYASKIEKHEAAIDWRQTAAVIARKIRAFNPFPVAFTHLREQRIKIHRADAVTVAESPPATPGTITAISDAGISVQCGEGVLRIETLQLPGKRPLPVGDILRGNRALFRLGEQFCQKL